MPSSFESLSFRDLLDAREAYHWHLLNKQNVVATAVGRYLIRHSEPWPTADKPTEGLATRAAKGPVKGKRTLQNSGVRPYSWPCVIVFVKSWVDQDRFGSDRELDPQEMVPKTLYLSDGRMVPVCVVEANIAEGPLARTREWEWPDSAIGGGFPIEIEAQGMTRVASIGCLVSDGHLTYAVTSRHVAGEPGTEVFSRLRGARVRIGQTSRRQLTRLPLTALYEGFSGAQTLVNLDVGLVEVDDVNDWTAQIFGIGRMGPLFDLSTRTLSLQLIDQKVVASGAASGSMKGKIKAFFYRYQSLAGIDHVSDFLIEPSGADQVSSRPGDSGTVWLLEEEPDEKPGKKPRKRLPPRPLAVQWGGHAFQDSGGQKRFAYGLATGLSNVCSRLEVDLVSGWNTGLAPYWGKVGHYSIATFAIQLVRNAKLRRLMNANLERISFETSSLNEQDIREMISQTGFIPMADVPDYHWTTARSGKEGPTHYADIDAPAVGGRTLLELCREDTDRIAVDFWREHYTANGHDTNRERGLLPFRVWQFFQEMVKFADHKEVANFVAAAGILSHYVGDACQTLHSSHLHDGFTDQTLPGGSWVGKDVHKCYEAKMIDRHSGGLVGMIQALVDGSDGAAPGVADGHGAAVETFNLMLRAQERIPPADLCDSYVDAGGKNSAAVADALWERWGEATAEAMFDGAQVLASLWEGAWDVGNGDEISSSKLRKIKVEDLIERYKDKKFVESLVLDKIGDILA